MDLNKINAAAARVRLETRKVSDLKVRDLFAVGKVKEVKTQFGNKVVLELDDEFQIFLPNHLQISFWKRNPTS